MFTERLVMVMAGLRMFMRLVGGSLVRGERSDPVCRFNVGLRAVLGLMSVLSRFIRYSGG